MVTRYSGYIVNGFRFHTYKREIRRQTQNSGVIVKGDEESGGSEYFGVLTDILELEYGGRNKIVLFKCDWWDTYNEGRGYKKEANGLTFVNTTRHLATNEPYVLASQVEQVYYIQDNKNPDWQMVVKTLPRNFYDIPTTNDEEPIDDEEPTWDENIIVDTLPEYIMDNDDIATSLNRDDVNGIIIEKSHPSYKNSSDKFDDDFINDNEEEEEEEIQEDDL